MPLPPAKRNKERSAPSAGILFLNGESGVQAIPAELRRMAEDRQRKERGRAEPRRKDKEGLSVWLTIPSARPEAQVKETLSKWREQGYRIALWVDQPHVEPIADFYIVDPYPGYAVAVNSLIQEILKNSVDRSARWFVIGGDDTLPDPKKRADEIARGIELFFYGVAQTLGRENGCPLCSSGDFCSHAERGATTGVMQPTGDRFADGQIDRICGSAWIGREFAKRVNGGRGPLWPEYTHMFVDDELQQVAMKYRCFLQRPDLCQLHMQHARATNAIDSPATETLRIPPHIKHDGYTQEHWEKYERLFNRRKAEGFPGSEFL